MTSAADTRPSLLQGARQIRVPGGEPDAATRPEVADHHDALGDGGERPRAALDGAPAGAAHGRLAVRAVRPIAPVVVPGPQRGLAAALPPLLLQSRPRAAGGPRH